MENRKLVSGPTIKPGLGLGSDNLHPLWVVVRVSNKRFRIKARRLHETLPKKHSSRWRGVGNLSELVIFDSVAREWSGNDCGA
jgi:hypothetical protein